MELRFVASMVLDAVANDYESIAQIVSDVSEHARSLNLPVERAEIIDALGALVEQGFVKAYLLRPKREPVVVNTIDWDGAASLYFYITERGKAAICADE